jgi:hypothetical protein
MTLGVDPARVVRVGVAIEEPEREQGAEDPTHVLVDRGLAHLACSQCGVDELGPVCDPGPDVEVEAVVERVDRALGGAVVGEHEPVEVPVSLDDVLEQVLVLARERAVDSRIGAHDRTGAALRPRAAGRAPQRSEASGAPLSCERRRSAPRQQLSPNANARQVSPYRSIADSTLSETASPPLELRRYRFCRLDVRTAGARLRSTYRSGGLRVGASRSSSETVPSW